MLGRRGQRGTRTPREDHIKESPGFVEFRGSSPSAHKALATFPSIPLEGTDPCPRDLATDSGDLDFRYCLHPRGLLVKFATIRVVHGAVGKTTCELQIHGGQPMLGETRTRVVAEE